MQLSQEDLERRVLALERDLLDMQAALRQRYFAERIALTPPGLDDIPVGIDTMHLYPILTQTAIKLAAVDCLVEPTGAAAKAWFSLWRGIDDRLFSPPVPNKVLYDTAAFTTLPLRWKKIHESPIFTAPGAAGAPTRLRWVLPREVTILGNEPGIYAIGIMAPVSMQLKGQDLLYHYVPLQVNTGVVLTGGGTPNMDSTVTAKVGTPSGAISLTLYSRRGMNLLG